MKSMLLNSEESKCGEPQKLDTLELVLALFFAVFRVYIFCGKETR